MPPRPCGSHVPASAERDGPRRKPVSCPSTPPPAIWSCRRISANGYTSDRRSLPMRSMAARPASRSITTSTSSPAPTRYSRRREGTILFKELQLTQPGQNPDGSRTEPSGRGYFPRAFNGADATVKDTKRFAASGGWGYVNFNHHEPKAPTAKVTDCGHACHLAGAKKDKVWTQFYPLLDMPDIK